MNGGSCALKKVFSVEMGEGHKMEFRSSKYVKLSLTFPDEHLKDTELLKYTSTLEDPGIIKMYGRSASNGNRKWRIDW